MKDAAARLTDLDPYERDLLVVLALAAEGELTDGQWLRAAHRAGLGQLRGTQLSPETLASIAAALRPALVRSAGGVGVTERCLVPILDDALARDRLGPLSLKLAEPGVRQGVSTLGRLGDTRMALALGDAKLFDFAVKRTLWSRTEPERDPIWVRVLGLHPSAEWLVTLGPRYRAFYLRCALDHAFTSAQAPSDAVFDAARAAATDDAEIAARLAIVLAALGREAEDGLHAGKSVQVQMARAFVALTRGEVDAARAFFVASARAARALPQLVPFALLAQLTDPAADLAALKGTLEKLARQPSPWPFAFTALTDFAALRAGRERPATPLAPTGSWINFLVPAVIARYRGDAASFDLADVRESAAREGFSWIATQLDPGSALSRLWQRREAWELALEALQPTSAPVPLDDDGEIVWEVRPSQWDDSLGVTARWVTPSAKKGKEIPLVHFESGELVPKEPQDRAIAAALVAARQTRTRLTRRQLALFVGHPRVRSSSGLPVRIEERLARLVVETTPDGALLQLDPPVVRRHGRSRRRRTGRAHARATDSRHGAHRAHPRRQLVARAGAWPRPARRAHRVARQVGRGRGARRAQARRRSRRRAHSRATYTQRDGGHAVRAPARGASARWSRPRGRRVARGAAGAGRLGAGQRAPEPAGGAQGARGALRALPEPAGFHVARRRAPRGPRRRAAAAARAGGAHPRRLVSAHRGELAAGPAAGRARARDPGKTGTVHATRQHPVALGRRHGHPR